LDRRGKPIETSVKTHGFDRDCFVATLLAMTVCMCHCEERSDEAISKPQLFYGISIGISDMFAALKASHFQVRNFIREQTSDGWTDCGWKWMVLYLQFTLFAGEPKLGLTQAKME